MKVGDRTKQNQLLVSGRDDGQAEAGGEPRHRPGLHLRSLHRLPVGQDHPGRVRSLHLQVDVAGADRRGRERGQPEQRLPGQVGEVGPDAAQVSDDAADRQHRRHLAPPAGHQLLGQRHHLHPER